MNNKLIILRGPSASGKTTVANKLFEIVKNKTTIISQDYYRFIFKPAGHKINSSTIHSMLEHNTNAALENGYNVILEGVLTNNAYTEIIDRLIKNHNGKSYLFFFNISLKETLIRHANKNGNFNYGPEEMKEWYDGSTKLDYDFEIFIEESYSIEKTINKIIDLTKIETIYND